MDEKDKNDIYSNYDLSDMMSVSPGYSVMTDDYYDSHLIPKKCECGCEAAGVGGHSTWCPKFEGLIVNE
jgi:hypothetical protein